jgi:hypothetical protein
MYETETHKKPDDHHNLQRASPSHHMQAALKSQSKWESWEKVGKEAHSSETPKVEDHTCRGGNRSSFWTTKGAEFTLFFLLKLRKG